MDLKLKFRVTDGTGKEKIITRTLKNVLPGSNYIINDGVDKKQGKEGKFFMSITTS